VGREAWLRQLDALRSAVKHLGPKEVAFELDVGGTQISDALNERDRKVWHAAWTHVVKAMLAAKHDETSQDMLRAIVDADVAATPFAIVDDAPMTPEEEVIALRRELLKFGAAGKTAAERAKRRAR
jgi:hypothetical protein